MTSHPFRARRTPSRRMLRFVRASSAAVASLLGVAVPAQAEEPTIDAIEYHPSELPPPAARGRLILTGAALTAGWYGVSFGTSYLWQDAPNSKDLRIPVAGPWMALADAGCGSGESGCSTPIVVLRSAVAVLSGIGQIGGLFAIGEGLFIETADGARAPAQSSPPRDSTLRATLAMPVLLPGGAALEVVGQF